MSDELKLTEGWLARNIAEAKTFDVERLHATIDSQAAEIAALREAVKPFSDFGAKVSDWVPDTATFANATFTYGDLRRAAAAYGRET